MTHIQLQRIDTSLPLPEYHTTGAVGFDLVARKDTVIPGKGYALVPNNIVVQVPKGYMLMLVARSSTLKKKGLMLGNGVGIIDQDYCGPNDELHTLFFNPSDEDILITRGERWSQGVFVRTDVAQFTEVATMDQPSRGGFGTTGESI